MPSPAHIPYIKSAAGDPAALRLRRFIPLGMIALAPIVIKRNRAVRR